MAKPKKTKEQKIEEKKQDQELKKGLSKLELINLAVANIEKTFGKGTISSATEVRDNLTDFISSGSYELNKALSGRIDAGYVRGTIVEIYGWESSGKTTLAFAAAAEVQKTGGIVAFIDAEHALDPEYATKLGVNVNNLIISQPDNGEQGLNVAKELIKSNAIDMLIIDSVAALVPQVEIEGDVGDQHMGLQARMMSQGLRELMPLISKSNTVVIFINQMRMKIGVMFGNPETTAGGNALKFYASQRLEVRRGDAFGPNYSTVAKDDDNYTGIKIRVKVVKNKVAPPFRKAEVPLIFETGIDNNCEILDIATSHDIIGKAGSWYSYDGEKIAQGKAQALHFLEVNPEICKTIFEELKLIKPNTTPLALPPSDEEPSEKLVEGIQEESGDF